MAEKEETRERNVELKQRKKRRRARRRRSATEWSARWCTSNPAHSSHPRLRSFIIPSLSLSFSLWPAAYGSQLSSSRRRRRRRRRPRIDRGMKSATLLSPWPAGDRIESAECIFHPSPFRRPPGFSPYPTPPPSNPSASLPRFYPPFRHTFVVSLEIDARRYANREPRAAYARRILRFPPSGSSAILSALFSP